MQYCSLQHRTLLLSPVTFMFLLWFHPFILSGVISLLIFNSILGTYQPGDSIFQCHIFLPFRTVHGALKARRLKWFAIPFSCVPHFVRTLHHDPSVLGGPTHHGLVSLSMETHSSTLAWKILWTEEPDGLQSMGSRRVGHN